MSDPLIESIVTYDPRNGLEHRFHVVLEEENGLDRVLAVTVRPAEENPLLSNNFRQVVLTYRGQTREWQITSHQTEGTGIFSKGISESLLPWLAARLGEPIVSSLSTRLALQGDDNRSSWAEKMWDRLQRAGIATYDTSADRFRIEPPIAPRPAETSTNPEQ